MEGSFHPMISRFPRVRNVMPDSFDDFDDSYTDSFDDSPTESFETPVDRNEQALVEDSTAESYGRVLGDDTVVPETPLFGDNASVTESPASSDDTFAPEPLVVGDDPLVHETPQVDEDTVAPKEMSEHDRKLLEFLGIFFPAALDLL